MNTNGRRNKAIRGAALALLSCSGSGVEALPDKTVVLTFDDAVKSHITFVAPVLREHGFGATFFVTHLWMADTQNFMTWADIAALHEMGFEIGNHTWTHAGLNTPRAASRLAGELALVEFELARAGVPKPVSFAWPGNAFGPEALEVLRNAGYKLARRGMQPEVAYGEIVPGPPYDVTAHDPLLIPTAGDAYPEWTVEHFKRVVDRAVDGKIVVLQFHGVPDAAHPWVHTPPERFREYMQYLAENEFNVIALKDVLPFLPEDAGASDATRATRHSRARQDEKYWPVEAAQSRANPKFWLENARAHGFDAEEVARVFAWTEDEAAERIRALDPGNQARGFQVLPYPGGRHPRAGFLEGAINPLRGTKVSIFTPWEENDYVVLDFPEAVFSGEALLFLAHTHIPTVWDAQNVIIENRDWTVLPNGAMENAWPLPNGVVIGARVEPGREVVSFLLWLENGTESTLSGLRTQLCLLLKGATGFAGQAASRMRLEAPVAAVQADGEDRWILIAFERCGRAWGNEKCPCIHSDPVLPDAAPGARVEVRGQLWFYKGADIAGEIRKGTTWARGEQ